MTSIIILWMVEKPKGTANTKPEKLCNINTSAMEDDKRSEFNKFVLSSS